MPKNPLDHTKLMSEHLASNDFYLKLFQAMDGVINPCIKGAVETLANIRDPDVEPYFAFLSSRMLGFNISGLAIKDEEYGKLLRNLGKYWQTRGSSKVFINFLSYIKNVELIYQDLWANSLDMPIDQLSYSFGGELWTGGDWFPTSYFDVIYSKVDFPDLDETLFTTLIYQLAPQHLVMRYLVGIESSTANLYLNAIPLQRDYSTSSVKI